MKLVLQLLGVFLLALLLPNISYSQTASFNYSTTTGTLGTTYSWIDCSGGSEITTFSSGNADDGRQEINWPFAFRFYDDNYTTSDHLSIGTNGFIRLDGNASTNASTASNYNLNSSGTGLGQIIALAVYDVGFLDATSHIYYQTTGTSPNRIFTIQYQNVEVDYNDNRYASIEVSFYETSNKVVILFGTDNVNRSSVDMGIHSGVSGYYNKWQEVRSGTNNTWIEYDFVKAVGSITYNQASTADVFPGQIDAEVLRMDVDVTGNTGTLNLNSIQITANNSNNSDIASSGVKLYRTTTTTFSTTNQLGTAQSLSSGTATFSSLNYDLPSGTTYIWAVYDIALSATRNNNVDMRIAANAINIGGSTYPSSSQSPSGNRTIVYKVWDGSSSTNWRTNANWTPSGRPSSTDHVVIPSSPSNQPHLYNGDAGECNSLIIESGATMTVDNTGEFDVYGDINNEGTLTVSDYEIWLYGSDNYIDGSGVFTNLRAQVKSGNTYTLRHNISCDRIRVQETGGTLNIGDYTLECSGDYNDNPNSGANSTATTNIGNGVLSVAGIVTLDGTLNAGTGTFFYNGSNSQSIINKTYYSLKIKVSSGTRTLTNVSTNMRNLEITGAGTASLNANININGNIVNGSGCTLNQNSHSINLGGNWTNNGSFTQGTQTVTLDGSSAQTIGGSSTTTFYNLTVNNSAGLTLNHTTNLSHTLTLTSGLVNTSSSNLLVIGSSATAVSGVSSARYIDGPVRKDGSSNFVFPVGDAGKYARIGISNLSGSDNFTAEYHKATPTNNTSYSYPITKVSDNEYWDLNRAGSSVTATVTLYWEDSQWSGIGNISELRVMHYGTSWTAVSGTYTNSGSAGLSSVNSGSIGVSSVSSFSPFSFGTIDNIHNPLPIELLSFTAKAEENVVLVNWQTASELDNDYFIIERSKDGINSERIGRVQGAGNSNEVLNYSFVDQNPYSGTSYYRLTQVDYNGQSETFDWVAVNCEVENEASVNIYPNPLSSGNLNMQFDNYQGQTEIVIFDLSGRKVYSNIKQIDSASQNFQLALNLPNGIYSIQIISGNKIQIKKLIIN